MTLCEICNKRPAEYGEDHTIYAGWCVPCAAAMDDIRLDTARRELAELKRRLLDEADEVDSDAIAENTVRNRLDYLGNYED